MSVLCIVCERFEQSLNVRCEEGMKNLVKLTSAVISPTTIGASIPGSVEIVLVIP